MTLILLTFSFPNGTMGIISHASSTSEKNHNGTPWVPWVSRENKLVVKCTPYQIVWTGKVLRFIFCLLNQKVAEE